MRILAMSADRPQDEADLKALLATLNDGERVLARQAVTRIEDIGANRGKSLRAELERRLQAG